MVDLWELTISIEHDKRKKMGIMCILSRMNSNQ